MPGDSEQSESDDHLSSEERSELMARINSTETEPEKLTRSLLHRAGFRFRKNIADLPGSPDVVLPKHDTVIFVHGCYWHRHDCKKGRSIPSTNREFWLGKFEENVKRDKKVRAQLEDQGWKVLVVWECELSDDPRSTISDTISKIPSP